MLYMVTFTINIPQMLAYIYHTWILWDLRQLFVTATPESLPELGSKSANQQTQAVLGIPRD